MKTKGLFLSTLFVGAVIVGCTNEEVLENESSKQSKNSKNYIAVNIVPPTDFGSRGTGGEFAAGSSAENEVTDAWFVFYNATGGYVDALKGELEWDESDSGSVEKISSALVVLNNPQTWPTQVVALLNSRMSQTELSKLNLTQLKALYSDFSNGFVMSNSVYKDGNNIIMATPLKDTQICKTSDLALANPVSIPVERVLAKVVAGLDVNFEVKDTDVTPQLDGTNVTFDVSIKGFKLVDTHPTAYLLKNINGVDGWDGWNDAANFRSYWANSPSTTTYGSASYDNIVQNANSVTSYAEYCHENTTGTPTKLLVAAQFKKQGAEQFETIIKYNATYFTVAGLKNYLNAQYFADVKYGENNTNDWTSYMSFVSAKTENEWEVKLALADNSPTPNDSNTNISEIVAAINNKTMSQWTDGKCYYYVDVEHFGNKDGYKIGIVRNHLYDINITSIKGLGTPVFDPSATIDPDRPEEENYYVAAEVKVLKWKVVSQNVSLE